MADSLGIVLEEMEGRPCFVEFCLIRRKVIGHCGGCLVIVFARGQGGGFHG